MNVITIIGIVAAAAIGLALALYLTVYLVKKSNDIGDSSGTLRDFHANVNIFDSVNDVEKERTSYTDPNRIFREHLNEAIEAAKEREARRKAGRPTTR